MIDKVFSKDGFVWWVGVVEDRLDPEKMGRVRVRVYGYHADSKSQLPTEDLPWAIPIQPINSAAMSGVGIAPVGPMPGTWVVGFFLDGDEMQQPAFFGTLGTKTPPITFKEIDKPQQLENKTTGILVDSSGAAVTDGSGNPVRSGTTEIAGWNLGQTSERYETGGRGPGTINNYNNIEDRGGASYGSYQLASYLPQYTPSGKARPSSKNSPVLSYIKISKYKDRFDGLDPGTPQFDTVWKAIASEDTENFQKDQHDYVKKNYYDVMMSNLKREGLDLSEFGPAVQDLVWSTAVQLGPSRTVVFTEPLKNLSKLDDQQIVELVSEYKIANASKLFKSSGSSIIASVQNRYTNEKQSLNTLIA